MSNADISPILRGAIEDFEHAVEHLSADSEKDCKYAVIHAASSIELALKEGIRRQGLPVFDRKPPYHSFGFYECLKILKDNKVSIPLESDIELLHQERNICVHLAGKPDQKTTQWLLGVACKFMQDFCSREFDINVSGFFPPHLMKDVSKNAKESGLSPADIYFADANIALLDKRYAVAVFNASTALELLLKNYLTVRGLKPSSVFSQMVEDVKAERKIPRVVIDQIKELRNVRNAVAHNLSQPTQRQAEHVVDMARFIFEAYSNIWKEEKRCIICGNPKTIGAEIEVSFTPRIKSVNDFQREFQAYTKGKGRKLGKGRLVGFYCKEHEPYWVRR